ncbi:DUF655 domain-containing protein [Fortiea contorta]|uniref:DUF655 domain-containing protein n=1 Tax=Fortiea contorta TaxID=1892405 RepID=UPI0003746906|nr:DUF655 domain-containing protein [Fortiea contorta]
MQLTPIYKYFFYIFVLIFPLSACQVVKSDHRRSVNLPQDPFIQVKFNHTASVEFSEPYRQQIRQGDNLEQSIIDAIYSAKSTIDIAVQELRLPGIAQAIAAKHKAGVKIRIILENSYSRPWSSFSPQEISKLQPRERERYQDFFKFVDINKDNQISQEEIHQKDALAIIQQAKVPWLDDTADGSDGSSLMHHKFVVVDNRFVIITSANFTFSDIFGDFNNYSSLGNANNLLQIDSPELASLFTEEFNIMWGDGPKGKPDSRFGVKKPLRLPKTITLGDNLITIQFSPTSPTQPWTKSSNGLIGKTLESSTKSIDMALFVFSEQRLANILENRHQQNVVIRALIEPQFAYRHYSEALDMMGVALSDKCQHEVDNQPWQNPITTVGVPTLPKGDLLHHKFAVIDQETVITGSHNWSDAANLGNDETAIVIKNPVVAAHYVREFARLYSTVKLGLPPKIESKITTKKEQCPQIKNPTKYDNQIIKPLNINTATLAELETLPGVGKKLARKIILIRQQQKFTSLQDLERVPGVSAKMTTKWIDYLVW